jgi:Protein of Unknown function (DUF2604)
LPVCVAGKGNVTVTDHRVELKIIVGTVPTEVETNVNAALAAVIAKALKHAEQVGQPPDQWELEDERGSVLDPSKKLSDYGLDHEATLYLSLKAGVGG